MKLPRTRLTQHLRGHKQRYGIALLAIVVVAVGLLMIVGRKPTPTSEPVITYSTDEPEESTSSAQNYDWRGAPEEPKRIIIDEIGVDAYLQQSGVDQNGKIAVPGNVHLASWFRSSVIPGKRGLSIIAGHVSGPSVDGVFKRLEKLQKGSQFSIELGNGDSKNYEVLSTTRLSEADSAEALYSQDPQVASQVNLITCGGEFDRAANQFKERVIVAAKLRN